MTSRWNARSAWLPALFIVRTATPFTFEPSALTVTRVQPSGKAQSWTFNPYWVRLNLEERIGRSSELSIASHGKSLVFASFLTDPEREDFAQALSRALSANKAPSA